MFVAYCRKNSNCYFYDNEQQAASLTFSQSTGILALGLCQFLKLERFLLPRGLNTHRGDAYRRKSPAPSDYLWVAGRRSAFRASVVHCRSRQALRARVPRPTLFEDGNWSTAAAPVIHRKHYI
jgi:hypothetical protein